MARSLAVATGSFILEGEVTDASDGNVTPAHVELALSHGYSSTETAVTTGAARGAIDASTQSAYARAGSLHASVRYGKGTLHNAPSDAVWSGGWCAQPLSSSVKTGLLSHSAHVVVQVVRSQVPRRVCPLVSRTNCRDTDAKPVHV